LPRNISTTSTLIRSAPLPVTYRRQYSRLARAGLWQSRPPMPQSCAARPAALKEDIYAGQGDGRSCMRSA
jgi:hypothetical protein